MQYKEMVEKTGMTLVGICKSLNEYIQKDTGKCFYSVDVEIKGTRGPVNIKLPAGYPMISLKPYELVSLSCIIKPSFDKKGITIEAVQA